MLLKTEECVSCGMCADVCIYGAIDIAHGTHGYAQMTIDQEKCTDCGSCVIEIDCPGECFVA